MRLLKVPAVCCLGAWVRLISKASPRRMPGRNLAKNVVLSFSAQLDKPGDKHLSLLMRRQYEMFETEQNMILIEFRMQPKI